MTYNVTSGTLSTTIPYHQVGRQLIPSTGCGNREARSPIFRLVLGTTKSQLLDERSVREFHSDGPKTEKLLSPYLVVRGRGTANHHVDQIGGDID